MLRKQPSDMLGRVSAAAPLSPAPDTNSTLALFLPAAFHKHHQQKATVSPTSLFFFLWWKWWKGGWHQRKRPRNLLTASYWRTKVQIMKHHFLNALTLAAVESFIKERENAPRNTQTRLEYILSERERISSSGTAGRSVNLERKSSLGI